MQNLINQIKNLQKSEVRKIVEKRLGEFENLGLNGGNDEWFSEMCFCLLTANSRAKSAIEIQKQLGIRGFKEASQQTISSAIKLNKHRFHNNKSKYIVCSRTNKEIKDKLFGMSESEAREWLVKNIKGLGYKEASHFLRNVGKKNLAILDRHILNLMVENNYLDKKPKSLNKNTYLEIEEKFNNLAKKIGMNSAELDLYMWYMKTGEVLK